jgi:hypothetical protein
MLKVVATTTRGKTLTTRHFYANCQLPPRCARLVLGVRAPRHTRIIRVDAYVNGRRVTSVRGRAITHIVLRRLPPGSYSVKLVAFSSSGRRTTATRIYVGCRASP